MERADALFLIDAGARDAGLDHTARHELRQERSRPLLDIIKEEIGPCKYIAVVAWKDWANNDMLHGGEERYPQPDGWALTTPYERVGYAPYKLDKFWQIDAKL